MASRKCLAGPRLRRLHRENAMTTTNDPVLVRFRKALDEVYGPRKIERVVLFGSRARGDARPDSDYDVAVFFNDPGELWDDLGNLSYQAPLSLTLRLALPVMAGEGPPSTALLIAARKAVDADLRRHDDFVATGGSLSGAAGITEINQRCYLDAFANIWLRHQLWAIPP